jgi:1,2-phenylacetyl-CoA epoxidase catalytic subunit
VHDWAATIARRFLYETADALRVEWLKASADSEVAGLATKMEREEAYHRMHAGMWAERLHAEPRFTEALATLWGPALGLLDQDERPELARRVREAGFDLGGAEPAERGFHLDEWAELWEEMTSVRRSVPGASW